MKNQTLVLVLLQAELRNTKLIYGLHEAGVTVEDLYTDLTGTIFEQIGFPEAEQTTELYDFYFDLLRKHTSQKLATFLKNHKAIALEILSELLLQRLRPNRTSNLQDFLP